MIEDFENMYHITYTCRGYEPTCSAMLVVADSIEEAGKMLLSRARSARIVGTHKATKDDLKPGKPILDSKDSPFRFVRCEDIEDMQEKEEEEKEPEWYRCPHCSINLEEYGLYYDGVRHLKVSVIQPDKADVQYSDDGTGTYYCSKCGEEIPTNLLEPIQKALIRQS